MSPNATRITIHIISGILALCSAILEFSNSVSVIQGINPTLAHYAPLIFMTAAILEKWGKAVLDMINPPITQPKL